MTIYKCKSSQRKIGDKKTSFAWLPTRLDNGDVVWFEQVIFIFVKHHRSSVLAGRYPIGNVWKGLSRVTQ